ncbi:DUF262 domain-containing protein [Levilactobacillus brevis]|uniref:DUF262 domain-containing protein n=1 Tax=Levilactobacillus brevis TaxID=1580 RepID=UPI0015C4CF41|nr:DUF262 domain-containing protein [Levilactobacillus brevis]
MKSPEEKQFALAQLSKEQQNVKYDIRDFPIKFLNTEFKEGGIYIPEYQRHFIWNASSQSKLIESILIGLPIPMMFFATDEKTGKLEIVDGAQRTQTLVAFIANHLVLKNLTTLDTCNGFTFSDLPSSTQRKFLNNALRTIVLEDLTTLDNRKEIFNRINTQGVKAAPAEVRMATFAGPFVDFVKTLALDETFEHVVPQSNVNISRKENYEMIFRFFAYSDNLENYSDAIKVSSFIDNFTRDNQTNFDKTRMLSEFNRTFSFAEKHFEYGFCKTKNAKSVPKARFEALAVGINLALRINPNLTVQNVDWIKSPEFKTVTTSDGANNKSNVSRRIYFVRDSLLGDQ